MRGAILAFGFLVLSLPVWAGPFGTGAARADFEAGIAALDSGDFATAAAEFAPVAEAGDAAAQFNLGLLYQQGKGVPLDAIDDGMSAEEIAAAEQSARDRRALP